MLNREINSYISNKQVGGGPTTFTTPFPLSPLPLRQKGGPTAGGLRWGDGTGVAGEALEGGRQGSLLYVITVEPYFQKTHFFS